MQSQTDRFVNPIEVASIPILWVLPVLMLIWFTQTELSSI